MPRRVPGWLLAGMLVLAGCGGEPSDTAAETSETRADADAAAPSPSTMASAGGNACELLSAAEVGAVLGQTVTDSLALAMPDDGSPVILSQCNYATSQNPAIVSFMLRRGSAGQTAQEASTTVRQTLDESGIPLENVAGLGDAAFFGSNQLHVFSDAGWYVIVTPVPSAGVEQARALAQPAIERLESGA